MKLKKFAALALAGVMAVSMLAGCANKPGTTDEDKTETTSGVTVDAVIAALDEKTANKVDFTYSASLQGTLEKAVQYIGVKNAKDITRTDLTTVDSTLSDAAILQANQNTTKSVDEFYAKPASITRTFVVDAKTEGLYTDAAIVNMLADEIDTLPVAVPGRETTATQMIEDLRNYCDNGGDNYEDGKYYYTFEYTGTLALTKVVDGDQVYYVGALTLTRTPSKVVAPTAPSKGEGV